MYEHMYVCMYAERSCGLWIMDYKLNKIEHEINHSPFVLIDCGELCVKEGGKLRTRVESFEHWWRLVEIRILLSFSCDFCALAL